MNSLSMIIEHPHFTLTCVTNKSLATFSSFPSQTQFNYKGKVTKTKGEAERLIKMIDKQLLASDYFYCFVGRVGFSCGGISLPGDGWTGKCHSAKAIISSAKVSHRVLSQANFIKAIVAKPTNVLATPPQKKPNFLMPYFGTQKLDDINH